ncbi:ribonuclease III [Aquisediminimonas profunda]|uniref:ribonuclease III n=1 Tax=Aquisediminimonas profunda TaxID=1550733 RepID=UPI001C631DCF|nr:ribonuclease III [Aquisediminimonas profunda]
MSDISAWLQEALGAAPKDQSLYVRALTHGSHGGETYERLEFLGDRVLGLVIADWLYATYENDAEGKLSFRLNALVTRASCARVGREIGVVPHIRLGKQARDDGAYDSDNVIGDVVEALIGALWLDHGLEPARNFVRKQWAGMMEGQQSAPRHPKSELQEWAASHNRKPPIYTITDRSGPHHAPRFRVSVSLGSAGEASAEGSSKQEAETAAAAAMLAQLK